MRVMTKKGTVWTCNLHVANPYLSVHAHTVAIAVPVADVIADAGTGTGKGQGTDRQYV